MKVYSLAREQFVPRSIDDVFSFFERPDNLVRITPPELGFKILTPSPIRMQSGTLIDYTVRATGFPVRWTTLITNYDPPHRFVDVQLKGPYSFWHHTHAFEAVDGGTMIRDIVQYVLPFGILGRAVHRLLVRRQLRKIFEYRQEFIEDYFTKMEPVDQTSHSSAKSSLAEV
jgi:ligand-binding SRPBCC domain-containing protein